MSQPQQPNSHENAGFLTQFIGWGLVVFATVLAIGGSGRHTSGAYALSVLSSIVLGFLLIVRGRRLATPVGEVPDDQRPPVLYLRSFHDEEAAAGVWAYFRDAFSGKQIAGDIPHSGPTEQLLLAQFFSNIGPYETIGRPGEALPHAGARRIYMTEAEWQSYIAGLLRRVQLVVLHAGSTPGLRWEVSRVVESVDPGRVLLLMTGRAADYAAFAGWAGEAFPKPFPAKPDSRLMTFGSDWKPASLPYRATLAETLAPWLGRNRIAVPKWKPKFGPKRN